MLIFKAAASYSNLMSDNDNQYRTIGGKTGIPIIDGEQRSSDKNLTESVDLSYDYIRKLKKTNRSFSIKTSLRVNDRESDGFNYSKKTIHKENNSYITDQKNDGYIVPSYEYDPDGLEFMELYWYEEVYDGYIESTPKPHCHVS